MRQFDYIFHFVAKSDPQRTLKNHWKNDCRQEITMLSNELLRHTKRTECLQPLKTRRKEAHIQQLSNNVRSLADTIPIKHNYGRFF